MPEIELEVFEGRALEDSDKAARMKERIMGWLTGDNSSKKSEPDWKFSTKLPDKPVGRVGGIFSKSDKAAKPAGKGWKRRSI